MRLEEISNMKLESWKQKKIQSVTERGFQVPVSLWIFYDETKVVVQELKCFIIKNEKWSQIIIADDNKLKQKETVKYDNFGGFTALS